MNSNTQDSATKCTLTPESKSPGIEFSGTASMLSLRLSGLEEGGLGGSGLFNLAAAAGEGLESEAIEFGSEGGAFSLHDLGFRGGLPLIPALGLGEDGGWSPAAACASLKIAFLGCIKCFIARNEDGSKIKTEFRRERAVFRDWKKREETRERERREREKEERES